MGACCTKDDDLTGRQKGHNKEKTTVKGSDTNKQQIVTGYFEDCPNKVIVVHQS